MAELKTKKNSASVAKFLGKIDDRQKLVDCQAIAKVMRLIECMVPDLG